MILQWPSWGKCVGISYAGELGEKSLPEMCYNLPQTEILTLEEKTESKSGIHKIIIIDRHDMPCRADCLPGAGNRGVSQGVHSADDYIIYRWKRIQNRAIDAQMRPATQQLQPGHLSAQQNGTWALQNGQVQGYFNGLLPPSS